MYKAIVMFRDMQDNGYLYRPGDTFPRDGLVIDALRAAELADSANRRGYPLIAQVPGKPRRKKKVKPDA